MFTKKIIVADTQRVAMFRNQQYEKMLSPGVHQFWDLKQSLSFEVLELDVTNLYVDDEWINRLALHSPLSNEIAIVDVASHEVAVVKHFEKVLDVLAPASRIGYWRWVPGISIEKIDVSDDMPVEPQLLKKIIAQNTLPKLKQYGLIYEIVPQNHKGILYINGEFSQVLKVGRHAFWGFDRKVSIVVMSEKIQSLEVNGQEILTKDRVSLRVNLQAMYEIFDVALAVHKAEKIDEYLYKQMQLILREAVSTRTLDQLLEAKSLVNELIFDRTKNAFLELGIRLKQVGLKDIILPGDMREILNQVVQAQKQAEANIIKRREETAATRSLLNTAKVIEGNPMLLKLKEMDAQEKIAEKIGSVTVVGGVSDVMNQLMRIAP